MNFRSASVLPLVLLAAACSSQAPDGTGGGGPGTGGASGGSTTTGGSSNTGGSHTGGASGGATTTGGAAGGATATGGAAGGSSGGATATGGKGTGGVSTTGGSGGTGAATGGAGGSTPSGASGLPVPPGTADKPKPTGAGTTLSTVNWAGFKGAVTYSFDDENPSQITSYSMLNAVGVPLTFYLWTGKGGSDISSATWMQAFKDGHEMGNHTKSHQSAGTVDDINQATQYISNRFGKAPYTLAAPNGADVYESLAKGLFFINRGVSNALIGPNDSTNPLKLPTFIAAPGADASAYNTQIDMAVSANKWVTMCVHGFTGDASAYNAVPLASVVDSLKHAKTSGAWVDTMVNIAAYWQGEKAVKSATTMVSGTVKSFSWKLPDKFPPGHYLRVTTDGGTLRQGGTELAWDPHGYYEIALDAGSVTLSP